MYCCWEVEVGSWEVTSLDITEFARLRLRSCSFMFIISTWEEKYCGEKRDWPWCDVMGENEMRCDRKPISCFASFLSHLILFYSFYCISWKGQISTRVQFV